MTGDVGINVLQRKTVQTSGAPSVPIFASRLLVSEANVSTMLFLSAPRSTDLKSDTRRRQEHAATPLERGLRSREKEREEDRRDV